MAIRILHIITRLELGGAQRNTLFTVGHLDRKIFQAGLAFGPGGMLDGDARQLEDVDLFEIPELQRLPSPSGDFRALRGLREAIRRFKPEIVHTHSSKAGVLGRLAARLELVPAVVHSVHGWGFTPGQSPPKRALYFLAERIASRWTSHWLMVSEANLKEGETLGLLDPHRVSLIRSGIRLEDFQRGGETPDIRKELGIPENAFLICQVGNFKAQKAPLEFIRLAAMICAEDPSIHALMVGDGPLKTKVEEEILQRDLKGRIHLSGWRHDIPAVWAASDLGVLTSRHEGLPRSIVEALASGRPVVATAVDGTPEVVKDGINGFLFAPGDISSAVRHILRIRRNPALLEKLRSAAPQGLNAFDIHQMVHQQEDMYRCLNFR